MSNIYEIEYANGITRVEFVSKPTCENAKAAIDYIVENHPYEKRLWILNDFDFSEHEIKEISRYGKSKFIKPNKIATVASNALAYGVMRQFMVCREEENHAEACVFRTEEAAIDWLKMY